MPHHTDAVSSTQSPQNRLIFYATDRKGTHYCNLSSIWNRPWWELSILRLPVADWPVCPSPVWLLLAAFTAFTFSAPFIDGLLTTAFDCATTGELNIGGCPTPTVGDPVLLVGFAPSGD
uniref:Uncharacterized protein n=1 Tax=Anopheles culicifacies TaxID=139723 RepID=A0A182MHM1_9DIPT